MIWRMALAALAALGAALVPAPAFSQTPFEQQVLAMLNYARSNPAGYAETLRQFRTYFRAATYSLPGSDEDVVTAEGVGVVDEAIRFLAHQVPLPPVAAAEILDRSAALLVLDQAGSGAVGHRAGDGSLPGDRARRVGGGDYVAEVVAYGMVDAADAVRQLIVDDGVRDRGHRRMLFSPDLRFAGVSCGPHRGFRTMCVVDLAPTADGRFQRELRLAQLDLPVRRRLR